MYQKRPLVAFQVLLLPVSVFSTLKVPLPTIPLPVVDCTKVASFWRVKIPSLFNTPCTVSCLLGDIISAPVLAAVLMLFVTTMLSLTVSVPAPLALLKFKMFPVNKDVGKLKLLALPKASVPVLALMVPDVLLTLPLMVRVLAPSERVPSVSTSAVAICNALPSVTEPVLVLLIINEPSTLVVPGVV